MGENQEHAPEESNNAVQARSLLNAIREDVAVLSGVTKGRETEPLNAIVEKHLALFDSPADGKIDIFARAVAKVTCLNEVPANLTAYAELFEDKNVLAASDFIYSPSPDLRVLANKAAQSIHVPFADLEDVASQTATSDELQIVKLAASAHKEYGDKELRASSKAFEIDERSGVMGNYGVAQDTISRRGKLLESIEMHKDKVRAHTVKLGDD